MSNLPKTKRDLRNVLLYTQELLSFYDKIIFDLTAEPYPAFSESAIAGLEGVESDIDEETWLRVRRLRETPPPEPSAMFNGWVSFGQHPSPDKRPQLVEKRLLNLPIEEISDLCEGGLVADDADVMRPVGSDGRCLSHMDVILYSANMPEFNKLWQEYVDGPWAKWAELERPRRRSIDFYNKLYQIHQRILSLGDDNPIELVFGVGVVRWKLRDQRVNVPLLEQLVELDMDEDGTICVRPRNISPSLVLKAFHALEVEGSKALQRDAGAQLERMVEDPDVGFSPFDKTTFESILRMCVARLSASGIYIPDEKKDAHDRDVSNADDVLRISDTWVLYVRQRMEDFRRDDIQRLIRAVDVVDDETKLPAPGVKLITVPSNERLYDGDDIQLIDTGFKLPETIGGRKEVTGDEAGTGASVVTRTTEDSNYFFPLPYNDDQVEIVKRLDHQDTPGVVVQGPPGTGKTHTIANIICHYMATGRRVLVTAKTPEALTALHEKLPENIRNLAISVIHNDREGARQLEAAVNVLSNEAKQVKLSIVKQEIESKQARLAELRDTIDNVNHDIYAYAQKNLSRVKYSSEEILPMDLAKRIAEHRSHHIWFEDEISLASRYEPNFTNSEVAEMRAIRKKLGRDLVYGLDDIPACGNLPEIARVVNAHGELGRLREIESQYTSSDAPIMLLHDAEAIAEAREMQEWLAQFATFFDDLTSEQWLLNVYHMSIGGSQTDDTLTLAALNKAFDEWAALYETGRLLRLHGIEMPEVPHDDVAFDQALTDLAHGKDPFSFLSSLFKSGLRDRVHNIRIEGRKPESAEKWKVVCEYRNWNKSLRIFVDRWPAIAREIGAPALVGDDNTIKDNIFHLGRLITRMCQILAERKMRMEALRKLFIYGIDAVDVLHYGRCRVALESLAVNLEKAGMTDAHAVHVEILAQAAGKTLPFHTALREFAENLGNTSIPTSDIVAVWQSLLDEAKRLMDLRQLRQQLDDIAAKIADSGAPKWAAKLKSDIVVDNADLWTRSDWLETWNWARADGFIRHLGDRDKIRKLTDLRAEAEQEQKRLFVDVVCLRTFAGLKKNLTAKIEAALAKFASAVARLGKGTGKAAARHRRIIKESSLETAAVVPCWILPEWRVSEQLPPELGAFDLVIVDEASQSDITALPAILRGKKVLIVGDDKQVSPTLVGIEDRKIVQLRETFLTGLPFADQMDPGTSLYELGSMIFPGKAIMLREHFRCVEPIIRFSSRFYPKALIPLRIPTATERIDPPLVDIYVPHGRKHDDMNEAEADVIVREITEITEDPMFNRRTIGVISLIGDKQAKMIYSRLVQNLGAEVMEKHRIMCGNASTFQGQERDIMFLSMVACPETAKAQTTRAFEQRFNVAMSRARDRLILVRSVASSHLKPGDLKLAVVEHFRNPMKEGKIIRAAEILEVCESDFERDFGRRLLDLGYRLRPQVPVGNYRIDFVIEGASDRRLAVELDGDKYHGPDRWAEDVKRQKALERMGWVFWRCWGSNWISDSEGCLSDLKITLDRLGIEPLGMQAIEEAYTLHLEEPRPVGEETEVTEDTEPANQTNRSLGVDGIVINLAVDVSE